MALNLSTLTNSATSADVLAEVLTTADFLEPVPVLRNLSRGSNKGGDAKQDVALNQPKALPYDGKGYLYLSGVSGNYASVPKDAILNGITSFVMEAKNVYMDDWAIAQEEIFLSNYANGNNAFVFGRNGSVIWLYALYGGNVTQANFAHGLTGAATASVRLTRAGTSVTAELDTGSGYVAIGSSQTVPSVAIDDNSNPLEIGTYNNGVNGKVTGKISQVRIWDNATASGTPVLDVDFTATNVRHGDTKFACATGQVVTINQSGNDPATVIKKSVLRFANKSDDSTNIALQGLLNQTVTGGYMFAAFSVLGDGGEDGARVFGINSVGGADTDTSGAVFSIKGGSSNQLRSFFGGAYQTQHELLFDDSLGDILHEQKILNGSQIGKVNNADAEVDSVSTVISAEEFSLGSSHTGSSNPCIDLEFLALFPASITDAQADSVRNYINNRNNVFSLIDSQGYYFFDPLSLAADAPVSSWNGQIVGSDNDANLTITQSTANSQPDRLAPDKDGMVVRFNDSNDHLIVPSGFVEPAAGSWQVVGTSLGTFAYRVNNTAVTELNLLGNRGNASYRQAGDLYGIILLPESATGADIEAARKLLIDRGAADGTTGGNYYAAWLQRHDIIEFKSFDASTMTVLIFAFAGQTNLVSFPAMSFPNATTLEYAWNGSPSLTSFGTLQAPLCTIFSNAWKNCSSLTSFPAGAKLGTAATGTVNFNAAWKASGLTSFPALDLSTGTNFTDAWNAAASLNSFGAIDARKGTSFSWAWYATNALTSFPSNALLGTEANNVNFSSAWRSSGLTSFPADIDLSKGNNFHAAWLGTPITSFSTPLPAALDISYAWYQCSSLSSFSTPMLKSITFGFAWLGCNALTDFTEGLFDNWNPATIYTGVFNNTWDGCTALTAQSVENILTSIDASGHYATTNKVSGGPALADAGIDIDYDGTTLSAATNSAIDSLSGKGWEVFINGVLVIPNILDLAPAAAYSLRSFDADADPNVVRVRRSTDGALSDFKASEVSDGTLTSWVNTEYNRYTSTNFNTNVDLWSSYLGSSIANVDNIAGRDDCLKYTIDNNSGYHFIHRGGLIVNGFNQRISFEVYIPSTNTVLDEVQMRQANQVFTPTSGTNKTSLKDQWVAISFEFNFPVQSRFDICGNSSTSISYQGNGTDTFYVRNIQIDQLTADGQVTTWYDQGGTNHATQPLEGYMPLLVDGGTLVTEGGKPALEFDGTDDALEMGAIGVSGGAARATYAVVSPDRYLASGGGYLGVNQSNTGNGIVYDHCIEANQFALRVSGNAIYADTSDKLVQNLWATNFAGTQSNDIELFKNGSQITRTGGSNANINTYDDWLIASTPRQGNTFYEGTIQEIVIYDTDQSANRTGIEANINNHFDIY